jgi:uncharacterized protein YgiM (DUF1202 family)
MSDTYHVIRAYQASTSSPLIVRKGDVLSAGDKTSEWPGWIWCTDPSGKSGWVPEKYVRRAERRCTMLRDYDATELTVEPGEEVTILGRESGWGWCVNQQGLRGWIPLNHIEGHE